MAEKLSDGGRMGKVVKTYLMLVIAAARRETVTYGAVGDAIGVANQAVGNTLLVPIWKFCEINDYPDLTNIVVRTDTGEPSGGRANYPERERVYRHDWTDYAPPTVEELESMTTR